MLARLHKLTGKDIRFLLRKKILLYGEGMVFVAYEQYEQRAYNQRSLQVSTKISKSSVKRNMIKRLFFDQLVLDLPVSNSFDGKFYKIFVYFHKQTPDMLANLLANSDKTTIKTSIQSLFHSHFISFPNLLCRYSDLSKRSPAPFKRKAPVSKTPRKKSSTR